MPLTVKQLEIAMNETSMVGLPTRATCFFRPSPLLWSSSPSLTFQKKRAPESETAQREPQQLFIFLNRPSSSPFHRWSQMDLYPEDDNFRVNGEEVHNLTLLGKIVRADDSSTSLVYDIDDGTGKVEVKIWVDSEDPDGQAKNKEEWKVGSYVRVYGHLRAFQGKRGVIAFNMRPVTDFNEITYHFLEVVYCNSHNLKRAAEATTAPGAAMPSAAANNAYAAPNGGAAPVAAAGAGVAATGSCSDQVFQIFNGPQGASDVGVHVNEVAKQLNGRFTEPQVREAVEHLVNEGHLYSTIDDDHFKSTLL